MFGFEYLIEGAFGMLALIGFVTVVTGTFKFIYKDWE